MKDKLILPITIIVASLIIGGFYYVTQINKQESIERQKERDVDVKKMEIEYKKEEAKAAEEAKERNQRHYNICVQGAEREYWEYMEINGTKNENTETINAETRHWDTAEEKKKQDVEECFKRYKQ